MMLCGLYKVLSHANRCQYLLVFASGDMDSRVQVQQLDAYKFSKRNTFFCAEPADFTLMLICTLYLAQGA